MNYLVVNIAWCYNESMTELPVFHKRIFRILPVIYVFLALWWFSIFFRGIHETDENYTFSLLYGLMPLSIGIFGLFIAHRWGGFKSAMGRALGFLSAGQFAWGVGNLIFSYYQLVLHVPVPYPGPADTGYFLMYPLSAIGVFFLFRVTGATAGLKSTSGKVSFLLLPLFFVGLSYYLLYTIARGGAITYEGDLLKFILDIGYPIGDVVVVTLSSMIYWLSRDYLGGIFRKPIILMLFGFVLAYVADFSFSYTTTVGTFFTANWVDLLYTTTFFIIAMGLILLDPRSLFDVSGQKNDQIEKQQTP